MSDIPDAPMSSNDPIENILADLIAVLRDEHQPYQGCAHDCCRECSTCRAAWPCETSKELDRAEARLNELTNGGSDE